MKPIGMPVNYLTADCIWNSFHSSGKRHLILTGTRGSGKTTLLNMLFLERLPGLTSWAEPKNAVYLQDNTSGEMVKIGTFDASLPGPGNQMILMEHGFAALAIPVLQRCMESDSPWIAIDEVGYLEAKCSGYQDALRQLLAIKRVAMVVRKQELPFLQELCSREDSFVVNLDDPFGKIGCVIMASGLGRRFGGNKLMADFRDQPMISMILDATEGIFAHRVVVTRSEDVAVLCRDRGVQTVLHELPHRSDTVRLGLEAMPGLHRCMFATADQPLLRKDTICALALAAENDQSSIWRTRCDDVYGSPVIFPNWTFHELLTLPEGKGGREIIKKYPARLHTVTVRDMYELKDVDSPEDLSELLER